MPNGFSRPSRLRCRTLIRVFAASPRGRDDDIPITGHISREAERRPALVTFGVRQCGHAAPTFCQARATMDMAIEMLEYFVREAEQ